MNYVLLVSDDPIFLASLRLDLLSKPDVSHSGLEIEGYESPEAALLRLGETGVLFDAAIVDGNMATADGVAFLRELQELRPDTIRILVSERSQLDTIVNLINEKHIDFFIMRPVRIFDLKNVLLTAFTQRGLRAENRRLSESISSESAMSTHIKPKPVYKLMVVDDEENVLSAIRRALNDWRPVGHFMHLSLEPTFFQSAREALDSAAQIPYDLVIADYTMPEMNGIAFLTQLKHSRPDIACIMLSGSADVNMLVEAVNQTAIWHFISKPWHNYELVASVLQALAYRDLKMDSRIMADLAKISRN